VGVPVRRMRVGSIGIALALTAGCQATGPAERGTPNVLRPQGTGARTVLDEMVVHLVLGTAVFVLVLGLLGVTLWRQRRRPPAAPDPDAEQRGIRWIWLGGLALPVVVLSVIAGWSLTGLAALADPPEPETVTIEVIGHRWWWEIHYPDQGFATANEMRVPVGSAVRVELSSRDVIHTFWVPELHGKVDMTPGETRDVWIQAERPGIYRGICAEFCGLQHARMHFNVVAMEPDRFDAWVEDRQQPPEPPTDELAVQGQEVFLDNSCVYCHAVDGTPAVGEVGPDLTDFADRYTIGAGIYPNNRGNLGGWIVDPDAMKPGVLMPGTRLEGEELQALLAYLETLGTS
jgi:cytochrome c oxidase subunit II